MSLGTPIQARGKAVAPVFCSACGRQLDAGARFCAGCGQAVVQPVAANGAARRVVTTNSVQYSDNRAPSIGQPAKPNNNFAKIAAAIAALAMLGGVIAVALHGRNDVPTPTEVAQGTPEVVVTNGPPNVRPIAIPEAGFTGINPVVGVALDGNGAAIPAHAAPVVIELYSDFSCPYCRQFKTEYGDQLIQLAGDPNFSVRYHVVNFLDRSGDGSGWSTLAASIFLQTALTDPAHTWEVSELLLDHQGDGLTGDAVVDLVNQQVGTNLPPMATVVSEQNALLGDFMVNAHNMVIEGVPTVLINGVPWDRSESLFDAAQRALQ